MQFALHYASGRAEDFEFVTINTVEDLMRLAQERGHSILVNPPSDFAVDRPEQAWHYWNLEVVDDYLD